MFGTQDTNALVNRTLEELEDDSTSTTYDEVMFNFIDYIVQVFMASQDASIYDAIGHMHSDEFHDEFYMYVENYFTRFHSPKYHKYSPNDLVWMDKEQLNKLIEASGR